MTDAPSAEQLGSWLRDHAAIIGTGETLVVEAPPRSTPNQVRELHAYLNAVAGFPVIVVPGTLADDTPGRFAVQVAEVLAHPVVADALHMALLRASVRRGPDAPASSPGDAP